jgi:aspartyl-tRNA(Asn)/glutamyl-tRNA(Gln) amidotransferase subunit C
MSLDPATVRRIAKLARIRVTEEQVGPLQDQLNGIIGWIEQLNEVDVEGVAPLTGAADMVMRLRQDVVTDGGITEQILANAPDRVGPYFAVPKVVE